MRIRRPLFVVLLASGAAGMMPSACQAQCCLSELFAGCRKAPAAYAVAPIPAPMIAPVAAPIPAPPPPVVVPVQQVSYVPETTYRTQYQCVPVTSYKPSSEIDPCTGCPRECMEQVTQYVQQPVNVPVTQYRAVYSTKYVQMQPGYAAGGYGVPGAATAPMMAPATAGAAPSPFASTVQTTPQAWGAAGTDVPQQLIQPGQPQNIAAPAMAPAMVPQQGVQQPMYQQPTFQQPIVPQSGTYAAPAPAPMQPQPTTPPMLSPTPSLKPIPELQRTPPANGAGSAGSAAGTLPGSPGATVPMMQPYRAPANGTPAPSLAPSLAPLGGYGTGASGTTSGGTSTSGSNGMPVLPGGGPSPTTGAFPKLLEPTGHTTSWQPAAGWHPSQVARPTGYPTAALPGRVQ
jgi:hypothetical protein